MLEKYPFTLTPLPYDYNALEPYIATETVRIHHDKHFKKYVDNLNELLSQHPKYHSWSLEQIILNIDELPSEIRTGVKNNAGGVYNHKHYFDIMRERVEDNNPIGNLREAIFESFESLDNFYTLFKDAAIKVFGSGYAWLVLDRDKNLKILTSPNQDVPLNVFHIMLIDVWEHSYYLDYQNRRDEYVSNWHNIIDWDKAERNYNAAIDFIEKTNV